jgi:hypothetical protein
VALKPKTVESLTTSLQPAPPKHSPSTAEAVALVRNEVGDYLEELMRQWVRSERERARESP